MFETIQREFGAALLDARHPVPDEVTSWTSRHPERRFAVYRNNVVASLINALRTRFPATELIVGEEFFAAMAHVFATQHPPRSPVMMWYGDAFPDFIATFEPARELAYLSDVARLEAARTQAYHAADAVSLGSAVFAEIPPEALTQTRATLHPTARTISSRYPMVTIWAMNSGELELARVDEEQAEDALIVRPQLVVMVHKLPPGGAVFFQLIAAGETIGTAAGTVANTTADFDLTAALGVLISSGVVIELRQPATQKSRGHTP